MTTPRGILEHNVAMSGYTSWRAGGPADRLYKPADLEDLCAFLATVPTDEPVHFVGLGSNLLVRDGGVRGTVIHVHGALKELRFEDRCASQRPENMAKFGVVYAEAGVASPKLARFAASHDLTGAEFLAGIPGTVGGALAMNAGCYGHETWAYVCQVLTVDHQGKTHKRTPREFQVGYRHVDPNGRHDEWFLAAWFMFPKGDGEAARLEIKRLLERRMASQPLDLPNAGSVFRNPPGDYAARLIESCGMKGMRIGDAQVSEKHANFIVNLGQAKASDIETLIETVREKVKENSGVELIREVRIIGEHGERAGGKPALQNFGKVAVMFGGSSAEREVSLKSGAAVLAALQSRGVDAHAFDPAARALEDLKKEGFQRVFIALHGRGGEDGTLQGALTLMGIPYTGSGVLASALAMDKWRSKLLWRAADLPIPDYALLDAASDYAAVAERLGLPLFVKPAREGSSIGVIKVKHAADMAAAYQEAARHDDLVLAEQAMSGGEYTVAVLGEDAELKALPSIRIVPATEFYDYESKYLRDDTRYLCPSGLSEAAEAEMRELALRGFRALGCRGWARVDFLLDAAGRPYLLEANTAPGMTDHSLVPMAARVAGLEFADLCVRILELAHVE